MRHFWLKSSEAEWYGTPTVRLLTFAMVVTDFGCSDYSFVKYCRVGQKDSIEKVGGFRKLFERTNFSYLFNACNQMAILVCKPVIPINIY